MRNTGKTKNIYEGLVYNILEGRESVIYGKNIDVESIIKYCNAEILYEPIYVTPSENNRFHFKENIVTEYLPTIIGYKFKLKI